jgi:FAD binding domain
MTRAPRIAIVRGGVGGLAAALALQRHGAEIVVCEQSPALNEIGAGLNLSPNALMALRVLGVEDAVVALGCESDFLTIRSWKSGRIISRMRRGASACNSARLTCRCTAPTCSACCAARSRRSISVLEPAASDKTAFQTAWLYGYDVGRELQ